MDPYIRYITQKMFWYVLTFFVAVVIIFVIPRLIPGNPISSIISQMATGGVQSESLEKIYESFIHEFGLDKPLFFNSQIT
jgi:ABC-type dipeptide/oligopeptide/nickel transport systems, permease components